MEVSFSKFHVIINFHKFGENWRLSNQLRKDTTALILCSSWILPNSWDVKGKVHLKVTDRDSLIPVCHKSHKSYVKKNSKKKSHLIRNAYNLFTHASYNCCCCLVTQLCPTLRDPMGCNTPHFSVLHHLLEFAQIHVHKVSDAIQPSYPLSFPSPSAFNLSQHQGLFQRVSSSYQVAKILKLQLQHQSFQWIFRVDFPSDCLIWSPCSPRDSQESSPTPQIKSINSLVLNFLYRMFFYRNSHIHT